MASKTAPTANKTAPTAAATIEAGGYTFDNALPIPANKRGGPRASGMADKLMAMPIGASFLEAVEVPEAIKDATERGKVFKEKARSVSNRLSGAVRRFAKKNPEYAFGLRTVEDDVLGYGVRVWRVSALEETAAVDAAPASAAA